jgi:His-Xaa-Ser system protein HxsD
MAEFTVDFDAGTQSLSALRGAAYRLLGMAACQIEQTGTRYVCRLTPTAQIDSDAVRLRFLNLVTDENTRESLRARTEPVRNLILSLAFGSLAAQSEDKS